LQQKVNKIIYNSNEKRCVVMKTVGERLIFLMELCDMKQTELADKVGISKQSLYKYLHCKCEPRAEIIAKMATALNTSADFIVGLTNVYKPNAKHDEDEAEHANKLISLFNKLSYEDKIRIEERIIMMLENDN